MSLQASKGRSHSWKESFASTGPSIWSRDFSTTHPSGLCSKSAAASSEGSSHIKEKETGMDVLRKPCRELQLKRPRGGERLTPDEDMTSERCQWSRAGPGGDALTHTHRMDTVISSVCSFRSLLFPGARGPVTLI